MIPERSYTKNLKSIMDKKIQLFILPFAGGCKDSFKRLIEYIDKRIEVTAIEYPGRGERAREPLVNTFQELFSDAANTAQSMRNERIPYSVFGYSMGAIIGYEFLRGNILPGKTKRNFFCAQISPKERAKEFNLIKSESDDIIINTIKDMGGINECLDRNKRFHDIYIKPVLSDIKALYQYRFKESRIKIKTDITLFYSNKETTLKDMHKWSELIEGDIEYCQYEGNHFFIQEHYFDIARTINDRLLCNIE